MEGLSSTCITDFSITQIKSSKREDGLWSKMSGFSSWRNISVRGDGPPFPGKSKTGVKFRSDKGFATF